MTEDNIDWDDLDSKSDVKGVIWEEDGRVYDFSETLYVEGLTGDEVEE